MDKITSRTVLFCSIWMAIIGTTYYLVGDPYIHPTSYMTAWLISACGFLIYIAYKPRKKK